MTRTTHVLLADIGGTNARFALLSHGLIGPVERIRVADCSGIVEAIESFLANHIERESIGAAVLGVAGTVENSRCTITNSRWSIDGDSLRTRFGFEAVYLLNDFEALAWSLPELKQADLFPLGGGLAIAGAPMLVVGPGTGLGVSCRFERSGSTIAFATEAGHSTLPGTSQQEDAVIADLRREFGHVSAERAVSGPGLENLYKALASREGVSVPRRDAAAITQAALDRSCNISQAALDMFCAMLGTVAGNLALAFCARGGVYLGGGIVPRFPDYISLSRFRAQFEAKGRYHSYLKDIPVNIIMRPDASLIGLKAYFEKNKARV